MAQNGERVDVLIIGGSLAGAAAAFPLARQGVRVRILEKARFPRPKICGEFLSPESFPVLARMGVLDSLRESGAETIERFEAYSPSGSSVSGELPAPVLSISRDVLDHRVLRAAEGAGAAVAFGETVMSFSGSLSRGFEVQTSKRLHHSRLLLGAWGRFSPLDPRIRNGSLEEIPALFGFKKHLEGESSFLQGRVLLHVFDRGYLGLSRIENGLVNLAALTVPDVAREAHHDFDRLLARLRSESAVLDRQLEKLRPLPGPVLVSEPVHLGPRRALAGDVLLAGDAAGVLDPYTGAGMSAALVTGEAAGARLARHLSGEIPRETLPGLWASEYDRVMKNRFLFSRLFRPVFVSRFAARLLHPLASPLAALAVRLTRVGPL